MEKLQEEIALTLEKYRVPKPETLHVKVNGGKKIKLSKQASPHLKNALICAKAGVNLMLVGPSGSGKSIIAEQIAEALELPYSHINLTAGASESWLFGTPDTGRVYPWGISHSV